ncbi:MAG: leucine-rich repeat protein [Oscillospiraceae bacterium]|nr:leucine-rich repeat protein [Oscillospiraceae bacterium]
MKKFIVVLLAVIALITISASAETMTGFCGENGGQNISWVYDSETKVLELSGSGVMADYYYTIWHYMKFNHPWVGLDVDRLIIGEGITAIGQHSFRGLKIGEVILPGSLTEIRDYAFGSTEIGSIALPEGIKTLRSGAFDSSKISCELVVPKGLAKSEYPFSGTQIDKIIIEPGTTQLLPGIFRSARPKEIELPKSLTSIGASAFFLARNMKTIEIPEGVTEIENSAFEWSSFTEIKLPSSLTSMGNEVFSNSDLKSITIPEGVKYIGKNAFYECRDLKEVNLPAGLSGITDKAFSGCEGLESIVIPEGVTYIGESAFEHCEKLREVSLPSTIERIDKYAFWWCRALENVSLPAGLRYIGEYAFSGCSKIKEMYIPAGVAVIDNRAFSSISGLKAIDVDPENTHFKSENGILFNKAGTQLLLCPEGAEIREYIVPEGVAVDARAFSGCKKLVRLYLKGAEEASLGGCGSLTTLNLSDNMKKLPSYLSSDNGLKSLILPSNMTEIELAGKHRGRLALVRFGSATHALAESNDVNYIPSIIGRGEASTVVGTAEANRMLTVNGVIVPAYTVSGAIYVSESDLAKCGYTFTWDGENRTTAITEPEARQWTLNEGVVAEPSAVEIWSSDVEFKLNGFTIPSLNIGNGESIMDINAVSGLALN